MEMKESTPMGMNKTGMQLSPIESSTMCFVAINAL
jgi:hypothetical protein